MRNQSISARRPGRAARGVMLALRPLVILAWLTAVAPVAGHGGLPDLQVAPSTVAAGGGLTVAGDDLVAGETLALVLVGNGARVSLGSVLVGRNGHFTTDVTIPTETVDGRYVIEADRPEGPVASAALTVGASSGPGSEILIVVVVAAVAGVGGGLWLTRRGRSGSREVRPEA